MASDPYKSIADVHNEEHDDNMQSKRVSDFNLEVGKGNIPNHSVRAVFGNKNATTTESTISENLIGRYPFPATAIQMTAVSTSANDNATGTGGRAIFIRGLTENVAGVWVDDSELIPLDGLTPVTTTKFWRRLNNFVVISVGSTRTNEGIITLNNGLDVLLSCSIGANLTTEAIWSTATNLPAYFRSFTLSAAKSAQNATFKIYLSPTLPFLAPTVRPFNIVAFEGTYPIDLHNPFVLGGGTDIEFTCTTDGGTIDVSAFFEMTLVETT